MTDLFQTTCQCCGQPLPETQATPFDLFYAKWPNKKGKAAAAKAFAKLSLQDRKQATDKAAGWFSGWSKENPQASPILPASYLNGRRWEDEGMTTAMAGSIDRAAVYANHIAGDRFIAASSVSPSLAREMLERRLVTPGQLRSRSIVF